jgi:hypothetical protein
MKILGGSGMLALLVIVAVSLSPFPFNPNEEHRPRTLSALGFEEFP